VKRKEPKTPAGLREAIRARKAPGRKPTENDRLPVSTFTGSKVRPRLRQLDIFGNETPGRCR
jgi:hypothetical protein